MADFCRQCSIELWGEDFGDFKNLGNGRVLLEGYGWPALCEGCGPILIDAAGNCISDDCLEKKDILKK